jgi:hypothetical protein
MMADISKYSTEGCLVVSTDFIKDSTSPMVNQVMITFQQLLGKTLPCRATPLSWEENSYHTGI